MIYLLYTLRCDACLKAVGMVILPEWLGIDCDVASCIWVRFVELDASWGEVSGKGAEA